MDLSHPEYALFEPDKARVLRRLAMLTEPLSGRRIHQLSGVRTLRTTQRLLSELVQTGLVRRRAVGRANAYWLNRKHILWPVVKAGIEATVALEGRIKEILAEALGSHTVATALYGSAARREGNPNSDIDILAIWKGDTADEVKAELINEASMRIEEVTGNPAQIFGLEMHELNTLATRDAPLIDSLRRDARTLTGKDIRQLIAGTSS